MDFETFKENLASDVKEQFYERYGKEVAVENHKIDKMNETYEALTVKPEDGIIGVNLNVDSLYKGDRAMRLTRYEQETIINFNAGDQTATLYTRDPAIMRKLDALVTKYPDVYRCIGETDIDKTYEMPKSFVSYRRPRRITDERRSQLQKIIKNINKL